MNSYCSQCGTQIYANTNFCHHCGKKIDVPINDSTLNTSQRVINPTPYQNINNQNVQNPNLNNTYQTNRGDSYQNSDNENSTYEKDMHLFVGLGDDDYYIKKFYELKTTNSMVSWNWAAFFFSAFWMLYRKMYMYGLIFYGVILLIDIIIPIEIVGFFSLAFSICSGLFGNYLYLKHTEYHLNVMLPMSDFEKGTYIKSKGGASLGYAILISFGISFFVGMIYSLLLGIS